MTRTCGCAAPTDEDGCCTLCDAPPMTDRAEFLRAAQTAAWKDDDGRETIHSTIFSSGMSIGANWDAEEVYGVIRDGDKVRWITEPIGMGEIVAKATGHELSVTLDTGKTYTFEVRKP